MNDPAAKSQSRSNGAVILAFAAVLFFVGTAGDRGWAQQSGTPGVTPGATPETAPGTTQIEPVSPAVADAIQQTIVGQIAAFQVDDGALALTYAVPRARDVWSTPEAFLDMVRNGYEAIYRPDEFTFEAAVAQGNVALQLVKVRGQSGKTFLAQYEMYQQPDGRWLIGGVRTVEIRPEEDAL